MCKLPKRAKMVKIKPQTKVCGYITLLLLGFANEYGCFSKICLAVIRVFIY